MSSEIIVAGETSVIANSFDTITVDGGAAGGGAGGTGLIETSLGNTGVIVVASGAPATSTGQSPGQGGTLDISGTLASSGTLMLAAGAGSVDQSIASGAGAMLTNTGVLTNAGALNIGGGLTGFSYGARYPFNYGGQSGLGAVLVNNGTLDNSGTVTLGGGEGSGYFSVAGGTGGALTNTGVLVNTGVMEIGGSLGGYYDGGNPDSQGGLGAVLTNDGTLSNQGALSIFGSSSGKGRNPASGMAAPGERSTMSACCRIAARSSSGAGLQVRNLTSTPCSSTRPKGSAANSSIAARWRTAET